MIIAGFGFRAGATVDSLSDALDRSGHALDVQVLATAADKSGTPAFVSLAGLLGLPVLSVDAAHLQAQGTLTHSADSVAARNTGSLAEAAALAAAGPGARLIGPRVVSSDRKATCALALPAQGNPI